VIFIPAKKAAIGGLFNWLVVALKTPLDAAFVPQRRAWSRYPCEHLPQATAR
jgi:hypothetical protein